MSIKLMIHEGNMERAYVDLGGREQTINSAFQNTGNKPLLNSLPFLNQLVLYQSSSNVTNRSFYVPLDKEIEKILELISNRLKEE